MWVWRDGYFCRQDVSAAAPRGEGVFETMRLHHGRVAFLGAHIRRLRRACPVMGLVAPLAAYLKDAVYALVGQNKLREARLRLSVFKTSSGVSVIVSSRPMAGLPASYALTAELNRHPPASLLSGVKSLARGFYDRASRRARVRGFDEVFFQNGSGEIIEGSRTNIFCVRANEILTPRLESGCLPGVARSVVIRLSKRAGVLCRAQRLTIDDLWGSDEVFVTNAVIGVVPVRRIDSKRRTAGRITRRLQKLYRLEVEKACRIR